MDIEHRGVYAGCSGSGTNAGLGVPAARRGKLALVAQHAGASTQRVGLGALTLSGVLTKHAGDRPPCRR